ncbi:Zn finger protein, C2C2 type [Halanaeroarchaeum sp. HSR-CO]|uniref:hypothetical protein n=1 Tax=Halanaeroarchaeum sp. HSR-CO TaxID=2866382 RepID=UPI00217CF715|nr:hypothetical protein [Halanaeroarchaeum sp. HSR-CO]UWG47401.1 Zn finger protein, C2C2 type [Halanaeroarchaeum sp. HSR-CO]
MIDAQPAETDPPEKATLICRDCSHESDVDGDWIVHTEHERQMYDCPICGTTITARYERGQPLTI